MTVTVVFLKEPVRDMDGAPESPGCEGIDTVEMVEEVDRSFFSPIFGGPVDDGIAAPACGGLAILTVS